MEPSIPQLCESLMSQSTALATLKVFYSVAQVRPLILADHVIQYRATAENFPKTVMVAIQVMCAVARVKQVYIRPQAVLLRKCNFLVQFRKTGASCTLLEGNRVPLFTTAC